MNTKILVVLCLILPLSILAEGLKDIESGVGISESNEEDLWYSSLPYAVARQGLRDISNNGYIIGFKVHDGVVYGLSDKIELVEVVEEGRMLANSWSLSRWSEEPIEREVTERNEWVEGFYHSLMLVPSHPLGCYNENPLRLGDIEADGESELVLFIGNDMFIFSPELGKTIFMVKLRIDDWFTMEENEAHFEYYPSPAPDEYMPQYQSALNPDYSDVLPGYRGYAKLYTGDFDQDGEPDLLVWRKLYESNVLADTEKGFTKVKDSFYHFERVSGPDSTGEYVDQETQADVIRDWLANNELTWQQGFPSTSECEGEEGQIIPETIDPLLHDPDVMQ